MFESDSREPVVGIAVEAGPSGLPFGECLRIRRLDRNPAIDLNGRNPLFPRDIQSRARLRSNSLGVGVQADTCHDIGASRQCDILQLAWRTICRDRPVDLRTRNISCSRHPGCGSSVAGAISLRARGKHCRKHLQLPLRGHVPACCGHGGIASLCTAMTPRTEVSLCGTGHCKLPCSTDSRSPPPSRFSIQIRFHDFPLPGCAVASMSLAHGSS